MANLKTTSTITALIASLFSLCAGYALAQQDFNEALCVSNRKREEKCSITMTSGSLLLKYATGRTERIRKSKIASVISKEESIRRGFIFTHVDRKYVYTIEFSNVDGDKEKVSVAFNKFTLSKDFESIVDR